MYKLFAVTLPGLETFTRHELVGLGLTVPASRTVVDETGGLEFQADLAGLYRANLNLRSASRVLLRFGEFFAAAFSELRSKASRLPWEDVLRPGQPVALRVTCRKSKLYHSDGVAERIAGAIEDHLGKASPVVKFDEEGDHFPQLIIVRLVNDQCTISVDTSGALLHRRGYRLETGKAPLRETLAAGLLLAAGWDPNAVLLDPFCGSGTIPIEAALIARRIAPGKHRRFAFMDWPNYSTPIWKAQREEAIALEQPAPAPILASDRDAGVIKIAQANADRAGMSDSIQFACHTFSDIQPPAGPGWVVTNPPYGLRVSPGNDLRNLYSHLGDVLRALCPGWQVGIMSGSDLLAGHTRLQFKNSLALSNGGVAVKFFTGSVPERPAP